MDVDGIENLIDMDIHLNNSIKACISIFEYLLYIYLWNFTYRFGLLKLKINSIYFNRVKNIFFA